ncbi:hypothetical protein BV20DRAFT_1042394 [Pilatotrama ljubarskyi]|nr:hypothetical protein BV20DRAFT_1042394 [Pilatotrama ljubarskyi]
MAQQQLWNDDILREIFSHLGPTTFPSSKADRPCLAALSCCARTGKVLYDPAIDMLWREIDSLAILLSVLSPPLVKTENKHQRSFVLAGEISATDYARFQFYARRVRKLVHRAERDRIHPTVVAALHGHSDGQPLLPSLRALFWCQRTPPDVLEILPLVSPFLKELCIAEIGVQGSLLPPSGVQSSNGFAFGRFIHALSIAAPRLETLTLSGNIHSSSILCVSELKQLKALSIINFAQHGFGAGYLPVLRSCAALSHLREFGINLSADGALSPLSLNADATEADFDRDFDGFHSLRSLRVHGSLSLVSRFLSHVSSAELASFGVFVPRPDRWEDYRGCLDTLCTRFASSLRAVRFSGSWTGNLASLVRPMDVLAPLLRLPQLEEVCIISGTAVALSLTTEDALTLAKAWPKLKEFKLLYQPVPAALPIDALGAFATHCPQLETLWLASVDLRGVGLRDLEASPASDHGLTNIWLAGDVAAADAALAARFIDKIFPRVDPRPVELPWHPGQNAEKWEALLVCLREVKAARLGRTL